MLLYVHRNHRLIRDKGGAQDGHLDFHTAPELWNKKYAEVSNKKSTRGLNQKGVQKPKKKKEDKEFKMKRCAKIVNKKIMIKEFKMKRCAQI